MAAVSLKVVSDARRFGRLEEPANQIDLLPEFCSADPVIANYFTLRGVCLKLKFQPVLHS